MKNNNLSLVEVLETGEFFKRVNWHYFVKVDKQDFVYEDGSRAQILLSLEDIQSSDYQLKVLPKKITLFRYTYEVESVSEYIRTPVPSSIVQSDWTTRKFELANKLLMTETKEIEVGT